VEVAGSGENEVGGRDELSEFVNGMGPSWGTRRAVSRRTPTFFGPLSRIPFVFVSTRGETRF